MDNKSAYTKFHPKWYRVRIPIFWWVHKWVHFRFILRELTSLAVAFYAVMMIFHLRALSEGAQAYTAFISWLQTPLSISLHLVALILVLIHSITWFNLAPKAIAVRLKKIRIGGPVIALLNYVAWIVISVFIFWLYSGGLNQ